MWLGRGFCPGPSPDLGFCLLAASPRLGEIPGVLCPHPARPQDRLRRGDPGRPVPPAHAAAEAPLQHPLAVSASLHCCKHPTTPHSRVQLGGGLHPLLGGLRFCRVWHSGQDREGEGKWPQFPHFPEPVQLSEPSSQKEGPRSEKMPGDLSQGVSVPALALCPSCRRAGRTRDVKKASAPAPRRAQLSRGDLTPTYRGEGGED